MGKVYFSLALLTVYGDIIKRFVPALAALGILYALAICILIQIVLHRKREPSSRVGQDTEMINAFVSILIVTYALQCFITSDSPLFDAVSHMLYMTIPLSFILVVSKYSPQFSLQRLARPLLWMMLPINVVGLIQFAIDPDFLISNAYTGDDLGGLIERNLLGGGFFVRFPSVFASADRYSAMALMQFYFTSVLMAAKPKRRLGYLWVAFNFVSSFIALGIAGARSRILIVMAVILLVLLTKVFQAVLAKQGSIPFYNRIIIVAAFFCVIGFGFTVMHIEIKEDYPVLLFLQQSLIQGDIESRVGEAVAASLIPDDLSLFGKGLGSVGIGGKPGEFGIQSTWMESGLIWGGAILLNFLAILGVLAKCSIDSMREWNFSKLVMCSVPMLLLIFAMLAGFTSAFELSSGILLGCAIAVAVRKA
jgi:hypothetical protein